MNTSTDLRDGERHELTITPVSRRVVQTSGDPVWRLLVEDENDDRLTLLATPDSDTLLHLKTGSTYRITDLLGAVPQTGTDSDTASCPECGTQLRPGWAIDSVTPAIARAIDQLSIEEPFGIVDERTVITRIDTEGGGVDDWQPIGDAGSLSFPERVCDACGYSVDGYTDLEETEGELHNLNLETAQAASADTVGLATGGQMDIENFRENVAAGYTPQPEAISDEGLFYDYYFETGDPTETDALFAPRYAAAVSDHPLTDETERYLSVGLDSTLALKDFERPRLELVVVLDVSGSMDSPFDSYYYDEHGRKQDSKGGAGTKLEAAARSLCALTEQLRDEDRLGIVLYNSHAHVAKPLRDVGSTNMIAIRQHIREITAGGGTNLADGFTTARDMLADDTTTTSTATATATPADLERRVVFMTDMMPNTGTTAEHDLTQLFADAADSGIHTTFIGMGLDANAALADTLSEIRGANHYFVHSAAEFERRLGEEFDYMVTPLVYDLCLELDAEGYEIDAVYGSPSADAATDQLLHVTTLFPSKKQGGEARGGVVLVCLDEQTPDGDIDLVASWTERDGTEQTKRATVELPDEPNTYDHDGIRKAIALSRYARELRSWARDVHERANSDEEELNDWLLTDQCGEHEHKQYGHEHEHEHERKSVPLAVSAAYADRFTQLHDYLSQEMNYLRDTDMQQELTLLERLSDGASSSSNRT